MATQAKPCPKCDQRGAGDGEVQWLRATQFLERIYSKLDYSLPNVLYLFRI